MNMLALSEQVLARVLQEDGLRGWARLDRKVPGLDRWIIELLATGEVKQITCAEVEQGLSMLGMPILLEDLGIDRDDWDTWLSDLLETGEVGELPGRLAGQILQIGLFGKAFDK